MTGHEHRWAAASAHATSEGLVGYQRCRCGGHRVAPSAPTTQARPRSP
ncbi:hypothetical protein H4W79_002815 [Nocardiopsis terrae]|uniref:Uncharacterized protein n=1 Tax=Nocardiopsis terrae TaxID=372655 RepID=A0ABR9HHU9_9ACTN|nr:hypothetical protein [Nocardiopsis terrae]MBE1458601.1 hypothetical protein [Nocardiopsis terrae]